MRHWTQQTGGMILGTVLALGVLGCPGSAPEEEHSAITATLEANGITLASGWAISTMKGPHSSLEVVLMGLAPNTSYELRVGGHLVTSFMSDSAGNAFGLFSETGSLFEGLLEYDVRGQDLSISTGGQNVLNAVMSGVGEPATITVDERTQLQKVDPATAGKARTRFRIDPDGRHRFDVELQGLAVPGTYTIFVDGTVRGTVDVPASFGETEFANPTDDPGELLLDFDPRGAVVDIALGSTVVFSGPMEAQVPGMNTCTFSESESQLPLVAASPGDNAKIRVRTREDCDEDVRVQVETAAGGSFDFVVDGIVRGVITTVFDPTKGQFVGELEFDSDPDEIDELLLDFDIVGALVEIIDQASGAVAFASTGFDPGTGGGSCGFEETTDLLLATAAAPAASGDARFRQRVDCQQDFRVQIEDLAVGNYDLIVGGVLRGVIAVAADPSTPGATQGEIEFDTEPNSPGEVLLDFDPRGLDVAIEDAAGVVVLTSTVSGTPPPGGPPAVCTADEAELPLLDTSVIPGAKGKARFRVRDDCDQDFRVEIENLPAGGYDLYVGGTFRGAIIVAFNASTGEFEGQIEFDTNPDNPGEVLLDFDPRGETIEVRTGTSAVLQRDFPL